MDKKFDLRVIVVIVIVTALVLLLVGVGVGISKLKSDNANLQQQVNELKVENDVLKHNYDMVNSIDTNKNSPELEALNTIGQAIANSKSVDLTIDTTNGKVHFLYEAK